MKTRENRSRLAAWVAALSLAAGAAYGGQLDLDDPDDVIRLLMKNPLLDERRRDGALLVGRADVLAQARREKTATCSTCRA